MRFHLLVGKGRETHGSRGKSAGTLGTAHSKDRPERSLGETEVSGNVTGCFQGCRLPGAPLWLPGRDRGEEKNILTPFVQIRVIPSERQLTTRYYTSACKALPSRVTYPTGNRWWRGHRPLILSPMSICHSQVFVK